MSSSALHKARPTRRPLRALLMSAGLLVLVVAIALLSAGGSYAAWNTSTTTNASAVTSGSTALTVNGSTSYTVPNLSLTALGPGQSVLVPITLKNVGTTPLNATVSKTTIVSDTQGLSAELAVVATTSSACTATASTVTGTRLATFTTTATPFTLQAQASLPICLEIKMDVDAPMTVAGGSTTFSMAITAVQVR
jgi:hypothetical protein